MDRSEWPQHIPKHHSITLTGKLQETAHLSLYQQQYNHRCTMSSSSSFGNARECIFTKEMANPTQSLLSSTAKSPRYRCVTKKKASQPKNTIWMHIHTSWHTGSLSNIRARKMGTPGFWLSSLQVWSHCCGWGVGSSIPQGMVKM